MFCRSISVTFIAGISLVLAVRASSQTQTTGRITGTVKDAQGAVIVGAELRVENAATGDRHSAVTDSSGTCPRLDRGYRSKRPCLRSRPR